MPEKTIDGWLVVDWKSGSHRTRQSKPSYSELGKNELLAKLDINVSVPEPEVSTLAVDIHVPEPQVHQAVLEALGEDELPGWSDAVTEVVGEYDVSDAGLDPEQLADAVTTQALMRIETRPDPVNVREYARHVISEMRQEAPEP